MPRRIRAVLICVALLCVYVLGYAVLLNLLYGVLPATSINPWANHP
ncbi:hypothetical protein ACFTSF_11045 [Kribbella sp. NPDC056951]